MATQCPPIEVFYSSSGTCSVCLCLISLKWIFPSSLQTLTEPAIFTAETNCECQAPHEKLTVDQARLGTPGQSVLPYISTLFQLHISKTKITLSSIGDLHIRSNNQNYCVSCTLKSSVWNINVLNFICSGQTGASLCRWDLWSFPFGSRPCPDAG